MGYKNQSAVRFLPLPLVRAVSLFLTLTIAVGDPAWAAGVSDLVRANFSRDIRDVIIPARLGTVTDRWFAPMDRREKGEGSKSQNKNSSSANSSPFSSHPSPVVVLIQDLHANISVQKNISGIIEYLYRRASLGAIYSEAAFGPCDVSLLRTLPSRKDQIRFEDKLLGEALIAGDEMAAARVGKGALSPLPLIGVDDPLLYLANVQAFRDLYRGGSGIVTEWRAIRDLIAPGSTPKLRRHFELTEKLLSLKLMDHEWEEYRTHREWTPQGSPKLHAAVVAAERFYTAAEARNNVMAENVLRQISEGGREKGEKAYSLPSPISPHSSTVVLLTGGFHTANIAHTLKTNGVSFLVVTPQVGKLDQESLYVRSMTEPPHETVRAVTASNHQFQLLKANMQKVGMSDSTRWLRRYFVPARARAKEFPGAVTARFDLIAWVSDKAPRLTAGALTFLIGIFSSTQAFAETVVFQKGEGLWQVFVRNGIRFTDANLKWVAEHNPEVVRAIGQHAYQLIFGANQNQLILPVQETVKAVLPAHPITAITPFAQTVTAHQPLVDAAVSIAQQPALLPMWVLGVTAGALVGAFAYFIARRRLATSASTRNRQPGFLRSLWKDQREVAKRLSAMNTVWKQVQQNTFSSQAEANSMREAMKKLLQSEYETLHRQGNYARAGTWREFGQRIGLAELEKDELGKGWMLREKTTTKTKISITKRFSRAPPPVRGTTPKPALNWKQRIVYATTGLLLFVQGVNAFIQPLQPSRVAQTPVVQQAATQILQPSLPKILKAPRIAAQAVLGTQSATQPANVFPATRAETRTGQGFTEQTTDGTWGHAAGFSADDIRLLEALRLVSTPGTNPTLAVQVRMEEGRRGEVIREYKSMKFMEMIMDFGDNKRIRLYLNPVAGEQVDAMGRGREIEEKDVDVLEEQGRTVQVWVEETSGNQSQILFGSNAANLKLNATRAYQAARQVQAEALKVTSSNQDTAMWNPKTGQPMSGLAVGAVIASKNGQPGAIVHYFNKAHFLYQTAKEESDTRGRHPTHWPYLLTPNSATPDTAFEIGFYDYDPLNRGELRPISGDFLRGDPLKANANKMLLKHVRNGQRIPDTDPDYINPKAWDELQFGDNAGKADLAESMVGLVGAKADQLSAKRHARNARIGTIVGMASAGAELLAGHWTAQETPNAGVQGAWAHLGAAVLNSGMSLFTLSTGRPQTIDEAKTRAMATDVLKAAHPDWLEGDIKELTDVLLQEIQKDPQLQRVFELSQEKKNDFFIKAILNVVASGVQVGAAVQNLRNQDKLRDANAVLSQYINENDHSKDLIDLSPAKWQDILSQLSPADRDRFVEIMGPVFTDGTTDARYALFDRTHFDRNADGSLNLTSADMNAILARIGSLDPASDEYKWLLGGGSESGHLMQLPSFERLLRAQLSREVNLSNILIIAGDPSNAERLRALFPGIDFSKFQNPLELLKNGKLPFEVEQELEKLVVAYGKLPLDQQVNLYTTLFGVLTPQEQALRAQIPTTINLTNLLFLANDEAALQSLKTIFPNIDFSLFVNPTELLRSGRLPYAVQMELEKLVAAYGAMTPDVQRQVYADVLGRLTPQETAIRNQMSPLLNRLDIARWTVPAMTNATQLTQIFRAAGLRPDQIPDFSRLPQQASMEQLGMALGLLQQRDAAQYDRALGLINQGATTAGERADVDRFLALQGQLAQLQEMLGNLGGVGPLTDLQRTAEVEIQLINLSNLIGNLGGVGSQEGLADTSNKLSMILNGLHGAIGSPESISTVATAVAGVDRILRADNLESRLIKSPLKISGDIDLLRLIGFTMDLVKSPAPGQESRLGIPVGDKRDPGNRFIQNFSVTSSIFSALRTVTSVPGVQKLFHLKGPLFKDSPSLADPDAYQIYFKGFPLRAIFTARYAQKFADATERAEFAVMIQDNSRLSFAGKLRQLVYPNPTIEELTEAQFNNLDLEPVAVQTREASGATTQGRLTYFRDRTTGKLILFSQKAYMKRAMDLEKALQSGIQYHLVQTGGGLISSYKYEPDGAVKFAVQASGVNATAEDFAAASRAAQSPVTPFTPSHRGGRAEDPSKQTAYTYDIGNAAILYAATGHAEDAYDLMQNLLKRFYAQRQLREGKKNSPFAVINGLRTDLETGGIAESSVTAGPNARLVTSLLRVRERVQDPKKKETLLKQARQIADFFVAKQRSDGAIPHDPDTDAIVSNEENFRMWAAITDLSRSLDGGDAKKYAAAAARIQSFLRSQYDASQGYFFQGSFENKPTRTYVTDVNALALSTMGPIELDRWLGAGTAEKILAGLERTEVTLSFETPNGQTIRVTGHDFIDADGRKTVLLARSRIITPEMSSHVISARQVMAAYFAAEGDDAKAKAQLQKIAELETSLRKISLQTPTGVSRPYAISEAGIAQGERPFPDASYLLPGTSVSEAGGLTAGFNAGWINPERVGLDPREAAPLLGISVPQGGRSQWPSADKEDKSIYTTGSFETGQAALDEFKQLTRALIAGTATGKTLLVNIPGERLVYQEGSRIVTVTPIASPVQITKDIVRQEQVVKDVESNISVRENGGLIVVYQVGGEYKTRFVTSATPEEGMRRVRTELDRLTASRTSDELADIEDANWNYTDTFEGDTNAKFILVFPAGRPTSHTSLNRFTREMETRVYTDGVLSEIITARTMTRIENTSTGIEAKSSTYQNLGSLDQPKQGSLLSESQTTRVIHSRSRADRRMVKKVVYPSLGQEEVQVYGKQSMPLLASNSRYVIVNHFDAEGRVDESTAYYNQGTTEDWTFSSVAINSRRLGITPDGRLSTFIHRDVSTQQVWVTVQDNVGRTITRYDGSYQNGRFVPEMVSIVPNGDFGSSALGILGVAPVTETFAVGRVSGRARDSRGLPISIPGVAGNFERSASPMGRSRIQPIPATPNNPETRYFNANGRFTVERQDLMLGKRWTEENDSYGRTVVEQHPTHTLTIAYDGKTNQRTRAVRTDRATGRISTTWTYGQPTTLEAAGVELPGEEMRRLGITRNTVFTPVTKEPARGDREIEFVIPGDFAGRAPVALLSNGQIRIVDGWMGPTNLPSRSRVFNRYGELQKTYTARLSSLARWTADNSNDPQPDASDLDGTVMTVVEEVDANAPNVKTIEYRVGEYILSRQYLAPDGSVVSNLYYAGSPDFQVPAYESNSTGRVTKRFHVFEDGSDLVLAGYAPDGTTLLEISRRDRTGHLLWAWQFLSHSMIVNRYQQVRIDDERIVNEDGAHETITRTDVYRVSPTQLDFTSPVINPLNLPRAASPDEERGPAPVPANEDALSRNLAPTNGQPVGKLIDPTINDQLEGNRRPRIHLNSQDEVDEIYEISPMDADGNIRRTVYRLPPGQRYIERDNREEAMADYQRLLEAAKQATPIPEVKVQDALGRQTDVIAGDYHTHHEYVGNSTQLQISTLRFQGNLVWTNYYPGFQSYDQALRGLPQNQILSGFPSTLTAEQRTALLQRIAGVGLVSNPQYSGFDSLRPNIRRALEESGLIGNTVLQVAIQVSENGGISADYRLPADPVEQLQMSNHGADRSVNTEWNGRFVQQSYKLDSRNEIIASYRTLPTVRADTIIPSAQMGSVATVGIQPDTQLPAVEETLYAPEGRIIERSYAIRQEAADVDSGRKGYDVNVHWTTKAMAVNTRYLIPNNPMGVDIAVRYAWDGLAINQWWLMGTSDTQAPLGTLPGSVLYEAKSTSPGSKVYDRRGQLRIQGIDGQFRDVEVHYYNVISNDPRAKEQRGEAYEVSTGRLTQRAYNWVRMRLANVVPLTKGVETVNYDPALALEIATYAEGRLDGQTTPTRTKDLLQTDLEMVGNEFHENQLWREIDPLMETGAKSWDRKIYNGTAQPPVQKLVTDTISEWKAFYRQHMQFVWGLILSFFLGYWGLKRFAALLRQKDVKREAKSVPPVVPVSRPMGKNPDEILMKSRQVTEEEWGDLDQAVRDILTEWGVPNVQEYNILNRVHAEVLNFRTHGEAAHSDDTQIFAELMRGIQDWRSRVSRNSGTLQPVGDGKDELRRVVLIEWLTEEMNRDGFAAIADLPSLLFYQYDKIVGMHNGTNPLYKRFGSRNDIGRHVRAEVRSLEQYLREQYLTKNDKGQPVLKAGRITYDDLSDFLDNRPTPSNPTAEMARQFQLTNFLDQYDAALVKGESAQFLRKLTPGDKTFDDKIGILAMGRNLRSVLIYGFAPGVWVLLAPLAGLSQNPMLWYGVTVALAIPYLFATSVVGKGTLEQWKTSALARSQLLHFASYYPLTMASFLGVSYYLNQHGWMVIDRLLFMNWEIWSPALSLGILLTMILFTFFAQLVTATVIGSFYSIFGLRRAGIGDVQKWKHLRHAYSEAKQKFITVMIPENARVHWNTAARQEELWNLFWKTFVNHHLRNETRGDYLITEVERQMLLLPPEQWTKVKDPEAEWRIKRALEGYLMTMPHARSWDQMPALSVMVTGFNEPVYSPFDKLNATSDINTEVNAGDYTDLNKVIDVYPRNWIEFARTFDPETRALLTQHLGKIPNNRAALLPSDQLSENTKRKIEKWVSTRTQPLEKTVEEIAVIHEAYMFMAYIQFPTLSVPEREKLVSDKLQIFINYNSMGLQGRDAATGEFFLPAFGPHIFTQAQLDQQVARVQSLMAKFPYMDWRWGADRIVGGSIHEARGRVPTSPAILTLAQGRKPFAQSEVLPFVRNNKILFFDVNASVHWEEALKIPLSLAEFEQDPQLKFILFGEYIYNRPLGWATDAAGLGEEAWTQEEQEFLSMFGALGFYGHSAIIDREALIRAGGYPHEFSGEDTIMTIKFWQLKYKTLHRMYVLLGKSRWAVYNGGMAPTGRWAQNTAEYLLTRWLPRLIGSGNTHIAQMAVAFKSLSFYPKKPLIPLLNDLYIGLIILLGASETMGTQGIVALGIMGALLNQGQALQAWFHEMLRKGKFWGTLDFGALFPAIYTSFVGIISNLGQRFHSALTHGVGGFAVSSKGLDQKWKSFSDIYYGEEKAFPTAERWTVWGTKIPMGLALQTTMSLALAFGVLNPWFTSDLTRSYSLMGMFFGQHALTYLLVRTFPKLRRELWSDNAAQRSAVRVQMAASIPSMVRILVALWLWGGIGDHWYWWWRIGVSIAVYWISSFSWQRRQFVVKQVINESEMGNPGWARFWDNALQTLIYASFLSSVGLIVAATYLASPMFTLFGFSIFYLGVPFVTFAVPLYGNVRPFKRLWEKVRNRMNPGGPDDHGLPAGQPIPLPQPPLTPYEAITVEGDAPVHRHGDARWKAREALYAEPAEQNYPFSYTEDALKSTILNRPFLKDQAKAVRSVVTPIPENGDGDQVQNSIRLFVEQLRKTKAAKEGKLLFAENQLGAYALHATWVRSSDIDAQGTVNDEEMAKAFASLKPFRMQLEGASLNPTNGRVMIYGYDEGESLVKTRGKIAPQFDSSVVNFPIATVIKPLTPEERADLIEFIKTHEQSQFGSFVVRSAYAVEHKNDMLRNATAVRRFDLGTKSAAKSNRPARSPRAPNKSAPSPASPSQLSRIQDLTAQVRKLEREVTLDPFTGLLNQQAFFRIAQDLMDVTSQDRRKHLSVLYLDLDQFKSINDVYGHAVGDEVILYTARRLRELLPRESERDVIGRIGGEEFAVLLPNTDALRAKLVAEKIRAGIESHLRSISKQTLSSDRPVTISVGIATWSGVESLSALLKRADQALYQAKTSGRNRVANSPITLPALESPVAVTEIPKEMVKASRIDRISLPYSGDEAVPVGLSAAEAEAVIDALEANVQKLASHLPFDAATGFYNKEAFDRLLLEMVGLAHRDRRRRLSLIYIDLDRFKNINDTYGHAVGDEVLVHAAKAIRSASGVPMIGCIGGEEFAVLLTNPSSEDPKKSALENAAAIAERIRLAIHTQLSQVTPQHVSPDRTVTASVGVTTIMGSKDTAQTLAQRTDKALYLAKSLGRNRVVALPVVTEPTDVSTPETPLDPKDDVNGKGPESISEYRALWGRTLRSDLKWEPGRLRSWKFPVTLGLLALALFSPAVASGLGLAIALPPFGSGGLRGLKAAKRPDITYFGAKPHFLATDKTTNYQTMEGWKGVARYPGQSLFTASSDPQWTLVTGEGIEFLLVQDVNDMNARTFFIRGKIFKTGEPVAGLVRLRLDQPIQNEEVMNSLFEQLHAKGVALSDWNWAHFDVSHMNLQGMTLEGARRAIENYAIPSGMCAIDQIDAVLNFETGKVSSTLNMRNLESMRSHEGLFEQNPSAKEVRGLPMSPFDQARLKTAAVSTPHSGRRLGMSAELGETTTVEYGERINLRVYLGDKGYRVQLWSNRTGEWPKENLENERAKPVPGEPGWYEVSVPVERDFEYTFRYAKGSSKTWHWVPLPKGNGRVLATFEKPARKQINDYLSAARKAGSFGVMSVAMEMPIKGGKIKPGEAGGGQGVVMAEQPWAVAQQNAASAVFTPLYSSEVRKEYKSLDAYLAAYQGQHITRLNLPVGSGRIPLDVVMIFQEGVPVFQVYDPMGEFFIELYRDPRMPDPKRQPDSLSGFMESILLPLAAVEFQRKMGFEFENMHFNDWQTALGPAIIEHLYPRDAWPLRRPPATLLTIHNLQYQGMYPRTMFMDPELPLMKYLTRLGVIPPGPRVDLWSLTRLPAELRDRTDGGFEWWGQINLMKGGIELANKVPFVSAGHLEESLTARRGYRLEGVLNNNKRKLLSIYNGIRASVHRPQAHPALARDGFQHPEKALNEMEPADALTWKEQSRAALQKRLGLEVNPDALILTHITRIVSQKGLDILMEDTGSGVLLAGLLELRGPNGKGRIQVVVMGKPGDSEGERQAEFFRNFLVDHPQYRGQFVFIEKKDWDLSRQVGAGSDLGGMYSIDEPGGLANQELALLLVKMIVTDRGGLKDFVNHHGTPESLVIPGFELKTQTASDREQREIRLHRRRAAHKIYDAVKEELRLYHADRSKYLSEIHMLQHFNPDWGERAKLYIRAYQSARSEDSLKSLRSDAGMIRLSTLLGILGFAASLYGLWSLGSYVYYGIQYGNGNKYILDPGYQDPVGYSTLVVLGTAIVAGFLIHWARALATDLRWRLSRAGRYFRISQFPNASFESHENMPSQLNALLGKFGPSAVHRALSVHFDMGDPVDRNRYIIAAQYGLPAVKPLINTREDLLAYGDLLYSMTRTYPSSKAIFRFALPYLIADGHRNRALLDSAKIISALQRELSILRKPAMVTRHVPAHREQMQSGFYAGEVADMYVEAHDETVLEDPDKDSREEIELAIKEMQEKYQPADEGKIAPLLVSWMAALSTGVAVVFPWVNANDLIWSSTAWLAPLSVVLVTAGVLIRVSIASSGISSKASNTQPGWITAQDWMNRAA